jgi:hypothetical protein
MSEFPIKVSPREFEYLSRPQALTGSASAICGSERLPYMKRLLSISLAIFTTLCLVVATERQAWGYVDPGTGLLALQSITSVVAAFGYLLRRRIKALFKGKTTKEQAALPVESKESKFTNPA